MGLEKCERLFFRREEKKKYSFYKQGKWNIRKFEGTKAGENI